MKSVSNHKAPATRDVKHQTSKSSMRFKSRLYEIAIWFCLSLFKQIGLTGTGGKAANSLREQSCWLVCFHTISPSPAYFLIVVYFIVLCRRTRSDSSSEDLFHHRLKCEVVISPSSRCHSLQSPRIRH